MTTVTSSDDDLFEIEAQNSPLVGSRTAVFLSAEERFWLRQEERTPPIQFGRFVGRREEVYQLTSAIARRAPAIVVTGTAGVGKTALIQNVFQRFPEITHFLISDLTTAWSTLAAGLVSVYGKIPTARAEHRADVQTSLDPRTHPIVVVFDDIDRLTASARSTKQLARFFEHLRPALGDWITAVFVTRDVRGLSRMLPPTATTIHLQPLSTEDRYAFLTQSATEYGVKVEPEALNVIADASFGLPVVLKSLLARSLDRDSEVAESAFRVSVADVSAALAASFADLAMTYDDLLRVNRLRLDDWPFVQAIARQDIFRELQVHELQSVGTEEPTFSLNVKGALRRLAANDLIKVGKTYESFHVHTHLLFAYIRAAARHEILDHAGAQSAFLLLLAAGKRAQDQASKIK